MKKNILLISSKAITINNFFDVFVKNKKFNFFLGCSDVKNLKLKNKNVRLFFDSKIKNLLNPIFFFSNLFKNYFKINNLKFDLILVNSPVAALYFRIIGFLLKKKVVYIVHGFRFHSNEKNLKSYIFYIYEKLFSLITYYYIVLNDEDYKIVNNKFNIHKKNILKIPSIGIDYYKLIKIKPKKRKKKLNIGVISAYRENKGYPDLLQIAKNLKTKNINAVFNCYGYDDKSKYLKKIKYYKLKNIFLNGYEEKIYNKIKNFDLVCHFSKREGMPISLLEAISIGIPVICYNIRGNNDIIKNNYNGYLIRPYDLEDFEKKLIKVYKNKNKLNNLKNNCKKSISPGHDKKFIKLKISNFINDIR